MFLIMRYEGCIVPWSLAHATDYNYYYTHKININSCVIEVSIRKLSKNNSLIVLAMLNTGYQTGINL